MIVYAGFITDEAANFLRTSANGLQRIAYWRHSDFYKNKQMLLVYFWLDKNLENTHHFKREIWYKTPSEETLTWTSREVGVGKSSHYFFPLYYFLFLIILGITSCPILLHLLFMLWTFCFCLAGIHQSTVFPLLNLFLNIGSLESKLLSYG